jgi:hypothetical protein
MARAPTVFEQRDDRLEELRVRVQVKVAGRLGEAVFDRVARRLWAEINGVPLEQPVEKAHLAPGVFRKQRIQLRTQ